MRTSRGQMTCLVLSLTLLCGLPVFCNNAGCGEPELDAAQFKLHEQAKQDDVLFTDLGAAYADAAESMGDKKHDLQQQMIVRTSEQWAREHTNPQTGKVEALPDDWIAFMNQRDAATEQRVQSRDSWRTVTGKWRDALAAKRLSSETVFAKDADIQEARAKLNDARNKVWEFVRVGIGAAAGVGGGVILAK